MASFKIYIESQDRKQEAIGSLAGLFKAIPQDYESEIMSVVQEEENQNETNNSVSSEKNEDKTDKIKVEGNEDNLIDIEDQPKVTQAIEEEKPIVEDLKVDFSVTMIDKIEEIDSWEVRFERANYS